MARSFNGTTDKIVTASFSQPAAATISCWVNVASFPNFFMGIAGTDNATQFMYIFAQQSAVFEYNVNTTGGNQSAIGATTVGTGVWIHVGFTYSSSAGSIGYFNGSVDGTSAAAGTISAGSVPFGTGFDAGTPSRGLNGSTADAAMWNVALTAAEIKALANGARPSQIRPLSLLVWLPLDGLQSPEPDLSGLGFNGTVTGTALKFGPPFMQLTPRWPQNIFTTAAAGQTFQPAWATGQRIVVDGIGI